MTKEQFLSGTIFRIKSNRPYYLGQSTYYFDGSNIRRQYRSWVTEELESECLAGTITKLGRIGVNYIATNALGTKERLNFENLVEFENN